MHSTKQIHKPTRRDPKSGLRRAALTFESSLPSNQAQSSDCSTMHRAINKSTQPVQITQTHHTTSLTLLHTPEKPLTLNRGLYLIGSKLHSAVLLQETDPDAANCRSLLVGMDHSEALQQIVDLKVMRINPILSQGAFMVKFDNLEAVAYLHIPEDGSPVDWNKSVHGHFINEPFKPNLNASELCVKILGASRLQEPKASELPTPPKSNETWNWKFHSKQRSCYSYFGASDYSTLFIQNPPNDSNLEFKEIGWRNGTSLYSATTEVTVGATRFQTYDLLTCEGVVTVLFDTIQTQTKFTRMLHSMLSLTGYHKNIALWAYSLKKFCSNCHDRAVLITERTQIKGCVAASLPEYFSSTPKDFRSQTVLKLLHPPSFLPSLQAACKEINQPKIDSTKQTIPPEDEKTEPISKNELSQPLQPEMVPTNHIIDEPQTDLEEDYIDFTDQEYQSDSIYGQYHPLYDPSYQFGRKSAPFTHGMGPFYHPQRTAYIAAPNMGVLNPMMTTQQLQAIRRMLNV